MVMKVIITMVNHNLMLKASNGGTKEINHFEILRERFMQEGDDVTYLIKEHLNEFNK